MKNNIWNVKALKMGELNVEYSTLMYRQHFGERITIPMWAVAIWNDEHKILVDTGIDECEWIRRELSPCEREADQDIVSAIKKHMDWEPDDVEIIINTHLHHDHCGENRSFHNCRFYVQEEEYRAAMNPYAHTKNLYKRNLFDENAVNYFDWYFLRGEAEIFPGLKVFPTPGHSAGQQSVLVNTAEGKLAILGDVANLAANVNENVPVTFALSLVDEMESLKRVRMMADYMIPGHEPMICDGQTSDFPKVNKNID